MFCPNCGYKNDDNALYCGDCGKLLEEKVERAPRETRAASDARQPEQGGIENKKLLIIGGISLFVFLLILIVVVTFMSTKQKNVAARPRVSVDGQQQASAPQPKQSKSQAPKAQEVEKASAVAKPVEASKENKKPAAVKPVQKTKPAQKQIPVVVGRSISEAVINEGLTPIYATSTAADSYLDEGNIKHVPDNVIDDDPKTAWCKARGSGSQEIELYFSRQHDTLNGIAINAGYHKSEEHYYKNARPKTIRVACGATDRVFEISLDDEMAPQILYFPEPVSCRYLRVSILDYYTGSRYDDVCISDIMPFQ